MQVRSIAILCHARQPFRPGAFAALMAERWRAEGRQVRVHHGLGRPPPADAALLHVDLTRVPPAYLALLEGYPIRLGGRCPDLSKRVVSRALVTRDDDYAGPVMVKTDLNSAGRPERALEGRRGLGRRLRDSLARRLPQALTHRLRGYRHYARKADVPGWVWRDARWVVERFFEEPVDGLWRLHQWFAFGRRGFVSTMWARAPVVKIANRVAYDPLVPDPPPAVARRREELGLDLAKVDYIVHAGVPQVIDANRTPNQGPTWDSPRVRAIVDAIAPGLDDYAQA